MRIHERTLNFVTGFQLTADLTKALAWPSFLLVFLLVFRYPISDAIRRIENFTFKGPGDVDIGVSMSAVTDAAKVLKKRPAKSSVAPAAGGMKVMKAEVAPAITARNLVRTMQIRDLKQRVYSSPRRAIEEAWTLLKNSVYEFAVPKDVPLSLKPETRLTDVLTRLLQKGAIRQDVFHLIIKMHDVKYALPYVKDRDLNKGHAIEYIDSMEKALWALQDD